MAHQSVNAAVTLDANRLRYLRTKAPPRRWQRSFCVERPRRALSAASVAAKMQNSSAGTGTDISLEAWKSPN